MARDASAQIAEVAPSFAASFKDLAEGLSFFIWPALILTFIIIFRSQLNLLLATFAKQLDAGASIEWKDFKLTAIKLAEIDERLAGPYRAIAADEKILEKRLENYSKNKNLFLVHRVRKTTEFDPTHGLPIYEIYIYLIGHKEYGFLNSIRSVEYYLGHHFGKSRGPQGTKYVVENGNQGFAVKLTAYGPSLCEVWINFHDGTVSTASRYLDFEGAGYRYRPIIESDPRSRV